MKGKFRQISCPPWFTWIHKNLDKKTEGQGVSEVWTGKHWDVTILYLRLVPHLITFSQTIRNKRTVFVPPNGMCHLIYQCLFLHKEEVKTGYDMRYNLGSFRHHSLISTVAAKNVELTH